MRIKKGDTVKIIQGKDNGKKGKVIQVFPQTEKLIVDGLNLTTKNVRAKRSGEKGQRVKFAAPLPAANISLVCPKCGKTTRVGYRLINAKKLRICKKCQQEI